MADIHLSYENNIDSLFAGLGDKKDDSRAREEAKETALIAVARTETLEGFRAYCFYVHGWVLAPHLIEWAGYLIRGERVCIVAPPETGKSRLLRAWCEWAIGLRRDRAIMIIGNTIKQARKSVSAVANVISHSARYHNVFPECVPTENWAKDEIFVDRSGLPMEYRTEPTLAGFGIDGAYQGTHVDDLIVDDPTDQKDVNSPPTMLLQREQVTGVLYDRLKEGGNLFGILTRWADDDLVPTLEQIGVRTLVYPAYKDSATPYPWDTGPWTDTHPASLLFAEWHDYPALEAIRRNKQDDFFKLTFLCQTEGAVRGERVFPLLDKAKHYVSMTAKGRQFEKVVATRLGADWGTTLQHQSAMVVVTKNKRQEVWVRVAWMSPDGSTVQMGEKVFEWKPKLNLTMAHYDRSQGSLRDFFQQCGLAAFKGEASVEMRIGALRTLLEHDLFFIDMDGEGTQRVWSQLSSYRYDERGIPIEVQDDLVDALLYAVYAILEASKTGVGKPHEIVAPRKPLDFNPNDPWHDEFDPTKPSKVTAPDPSRRSMQKYGI